MRSRSSGEQRADRIAAAGVGDHGDAARLVRGVDDALQRLVGAEPAPHLETSSAASFRFLTCPSRMADVRTW